MASVLLVLLLHLLMLAHPLLMMGATATLVGPTTCATTFSWSTGDTSASINNLSPGNYTVYTTDCQGCIDSATVTVGVVAPACAVAPYSENFDTGMGNWTTANEGTGTLLGWYSGTSTPSLATGPQYGDTTGGSFMYIETSNTGGPYTLTSECIDITALSNPSLRFYYHMYGATMGTLDVSINGTSVWSLSGDQGNSWIQAQVDLSSFVGSNVIITFTGTRGTSFTGDMAIDAIEVDEAQSGGCTDPLACNYDPAAVIDDGSCYNLTVSTSATDVLCTADSNGTATATANISNVSYSWSNGGSTASISALLPGTYTVTVQDTFGCTSSASATVASPSSISGSIIIGNESAIGASDGQMDLTALGGTPCSTSDTVIPGTHSSNFINSY